MPKKTTKNVQKQPVFSTAIVVAGLGFVGTIIAAYIGYLGIRSQLVIPINTTQTAESKFLTTKTMVSPTAGAVSLDDTPTTSNSFRLFDAMTWPLVFQDSFNSNNADWPLTEIQKESVSIQSGIEKGTYYWDYLNNLSTWYWFDTPLYSYSNFYLSIKVRRLPITNSSTWYGIAFRVQGNKAYIFYIKDDQKYYFGIYDNEKWTDLIGETKISQITQGEFNELSVIADGSDFLLYINKTPVGTVTDNTLSEGNILLSLGGQSGGNAIVEFDDFELREKP